MAIESADAGDLLRAAEHARRAAQLDGENADAVTAAASLGAVEEGLADRKSGGEGGGGERGGRGLAQKQTE